METHVGECSFEVVPVLELIESVDDLRVALNAPAELLEKLEEQLKKGRQREDVRLRSSVFAEDH